MDDIRQLSTHLSNEKRGKDDWFEELFIEWGEWRRRGLPGMGIGAQTPVAIAMELTKACKSGAQPKQTRCAVAVIPHYWMHRRMSKVNNVVWGLQAKHQEMLIRYYEDGWKADDFCNERHWKKDTYYARLSEARRAARTHQIIKELLGRS